MRWAFAPAWGLVAALLLPLAAHLLARHPPRRVPFPSLRFLRAVPAVSRRVHTLHDRPLWALRSIVVVVIVAAAAGPTLETRARQTSWAPGAHRAVVSVADGPAAIAADPALDRTRHYRDPMVRHGLAAAVADAPAVGTYEIVVRWDGRRAALDVQDLRVIPEHIGLTLERAPSDTRDATLTDRPRVELLASPDDLPRDAGAAGGAPAVKGCDPAVRVLGPGHVARGAWLERAEAPDAMAWRLQERMRADPRLIDAAQRSRLDERVADERKPLSTFAPLAHDADGSVIVWGASAAGRPLVVLDARPGDPVTVWAPAVAEGALWSLGGGPVEDVRVWSDEEMALAGRPARHLGSVDLPGGLDTRAAWAAVLLLLAVESWTRRQVARRPDAPLVQDDAA
jgi:hypothetical protein